MQGKRRRQPAPPTAAEPVPDSRKPASEKPAAGSTSVRYDPDELFPNSPRLSEREKEALELMADGKANGVIATVMGNSKRTVEDFIAGLVKKLDVAGRDEAVAFYHQAIEAKLERRVTEREAQIRTLENQVAALRRELRRRP